MAVWVPPALMDNDTARGETEEKSDAGRAALNFFAPAVDGTPRKRRRRRRITRNECGRTAKSLEDKDYGSRSDRPL